MAGISWKIQSKASPELKEVDLSTDNAWEEWGHRDPYYGVITSPKFRRKELTADAIAEFFESGSTHAEYVLGTIKTHIDPLFCPVSIVDFGCGVGRVVIPFAKVGKKVVGVDVSASMLGEARKNCEYFGIKNVELLLSDDKLLALHEVYDLIHSFIVFQHIAPQRGRELFRILVSRLKVGGVAAIHVSYAKSRLAEVYGFEADCPPSTTTKGKIWKTVRTTVPSKNDPEMQMNPYLLNELLFIMQNSGIQKFHVEFTDHGGELGVFLFFKKDRASNVDSL